MNLLTYELINGLKYSVNGEHLKENYNECCIDYKLGLISKNDLNMLENLYSVILAELYAKDLKERFEKNYHIYF